METVLAFLDSFYGYGDFGLLALRIAVGAIFLVHGIGKWKLWQTGAQAPMLGMMRLLSVVEPLAGLSVLLGFFTQIGAVLLGLVMLGALYFKIFVWKKGFTSEGGWEFDLVLLAANLALIFHGAGWLSLDFYLLDLL